MNAQAVIAHQLQGVMLHHDLMLSFAVLGKRGKAMKHRRHMYCEMKNLDKTNFAVIQQTGKIVDHGALVRVKLPEVTATMTDEQKKAACRSLMDAWRQWEQSTVDLYQRELTTDAQNQWLKYLMDSAESELKHIPLS